MRNGVAINAYHKSIPNVYQYLALTLPSFLFLSFSTAHRLRGRQAPKVAKRQGTFAAASSSRASDLSLIIVPGVGL